MVAGGGTGGVTVFYGEQLNHTDGEIIYLDFSRASMQIAQKRARARGLKNIIWMHSWIEDIKFLGMGYFEQLESSGVLHHLKSPLLGLNILKDTLVRNGGMQLMIYGKYGRTSAYQMQDLLKIVNSEQKNMEMELLNSKKVLLVIPTSNWFVINPVVTDHTRGSIGQYDIFLHKRDKSFNIFSMHQWLARAGLNFVDFTDYKTRYILSIKYSIHNEGMNRMLANLDTTKQSSITELMRGDIKKYTFYTSKVKDSEADISKPSIKMYICGAPHGLRKALLNSNNERTFRNQTYFFVWLSNSIVPLPSFDDKSAPFRQYVGPNSNAILTYWKLNRFIIFLIHKLLNFNTGIILKSTYSEYRKKTTSNESNYELFKMAEDFYMSMKHTGLLLLKKSYVTPFPKTTFNNYFKVHSV